MSLDGITASDAVYAWACDQTYFNVGQSLDELLPFLLKILYPRSVISKKVGRRRQLIGRELRRPKCIGAVENWIIRMCIFKCRRLEWCGCRGWRAAGHVWCCRNLDFLRVDEFAGIACAELLGGHVSLCISRYSRLLAGKQLNVLTRGR